MIQEDVLYSSSGFLKSMNIVHGDFRWIETFFWLSISFKYISKTVKAIETKLSLFNLQLIGFKTIFADYHLTVSEWHTSKFYVGTLFPSHTLVADS